MAKLIIGGKAPSFVETPEEGEIWGINDFFMFKPCTMIIEMHDYEWTVEEALRHRLACTRPGYTLHDGYTWAVSYVDYMKTKAKEINKRKLPLVSIRKYDFIPTSIAYPLKEVIHSVSGGRFYFVGGISYMVALAIYQEKWDEIALYGCDLDGREEWGYQRPCLEHYLGIAVGRGIRVSVSGSDTKVLRTPYDMAYGYLGTYPKLVNTEEDSK